MMVRNILSNWTGIIVTGIISFILTPILIHSLGDFYYGMWILAVSVLDYYGLLDLGIRTTLHRFVGRLKGTNERAALNETIATALAISIGIGVLVVGLTLALMLLLPKFFIVQGQAREVFQGLVLFLGLSIAILFPARILGAYLCGLQRFDFYNLGLIVTALARAILIVAILRLGYGVLGVAWVTLGVAVLALLLNWRLVRRADAAASIELRQTNWARIRELSKFSFFVFLNTVGDYLRFYTGSVVIGRLLSVALVTPFSVASRLLSYLKEMVLGVAGPLMPRMSELEGQQKFLELRQLFLRGTKMATLLSLFIGSLFVLDGKALLRLWLGERFADTYSLVLVLTAGYVVCLAQWPSRDVLYAKGRHRPLGWWTLGEGAANLLLSIYWARKYGLLGVALGTAVPMLFTGLVVQPWYVLHLMGVSVGQYVRQALAGPVLACALFLGFCHLVARGQAQPGPGEFLLSLVWQSGLFALLAYLIGLARPERQLVLERSKQIGVTALLMSRTALR